MTPDLEPLLELLETANTALGSIRKKGLSASFPGFETVARQLALMLSSLHCPEQLQNQPRPDPRLVARIITDSWDLGSPVTDLILRSADAYARKHSV